MAKGSAVSSSLPARQPVQPADDVVLYDNPEEEVISQEDVDLNSVGDENEDMARELGYGTFDEMEAHGRRQGWRPLDEYGGAPGTWKDLATFIRDGQNFLPFVKKENGQLKDQLGRSQAEIRNLQQQVGAMSADMQKLLKFSREADQKGYNRARQELEAQRREAVQAGDVTTYDEVTDKLNRMADEREAVHDDPPPPAPDPQRQPPPRQDVQVNPELDAWVEANKGWFLNNQTPELHYAMMKYDVEVKREMPGATVTEQLNVAKERVMAEFPEKFGRRPPNRQPVVPADENLPPPPADPNLGFRKPAGSRQPELRRTPPRQTQRMDAVTIDQALTDPAQRREAHMGYRRARNSMPDLTEAEYVKIYMDPHADVLETIEQAKGK